MASIIFHSILTTLMGIMKKFLQSLEDPDRPLLGPNYWTLKKFGFILPKKFISKCFCIFIHEVVTFFVATQFMELYFIATDFDMILTNLKISMLSVVCVVKSNTFVMWQKKWRSVIEYVTAADKEEREDADDIRSGILNNYTAYCRRITYFYWVLVFTTFVTTTQTPLIRLTFSSSLRENVMNGTENFPHIFSSWMPFDKYHNPGIWITVVWHVSVCAYGASIMAGYDISAVVIMVFFSGKLDLLKERCKLMMGSSGKGISDEEANRMFRKLHRSHIMLFKYSKIFNSVLSPVMFFYVVICSLMLCVSAYQLTTAKDAAQKIQMIEYLIFGVAQLFMFCWHSNIVLHKCQKLSQGLYESEWWVANVCQRKSLIIFMGQMRRDIYFTAGPFTNLTLSTFLSILKGAYSYYTLLRK